MCCESSFIYRKTTSSIKGKIHFLKWVAFFDYFRGENSRQWHLETSPTQAQSHKGISCELKAWRKLPDCWKCTQLLIFRRVYPNHFWIEYPRLVGRREGINGLKNLNNSYDKRHFVKISHTQTTLSSALKQNIEGPTAIFILLIN